jgi:hypothetical protein
MTINPYNYGQVGAITMISNSSGPIGKADEIAKVARKAVAFEGFVAPIGARVKAEGAGLGSFVNAYNDFLNEAVGSDLSGGKQMEADISKYEFMDYMFNKMFLNPAWYLSLEKLPETELEKVQIQLRGFITMLDYENSKLLEKLSAVSGADLATSVEK